MLYVLASPIISTHALREEGDNQLTGLGGAEGISTHALREEGDRPSFGMEFAEKKFLPTPSARRATFAVLGGRNRPPDFYPRPPRGGRPYV